MLSVNLGISLPNYCECEDIAELENARLIAREKGMMTRFESHVIHHRFIHSPINSPMADHSVHAMLDL